MDAFAHETVTVSTTAIGLTTATFAPAAAPGAEMAMIAVEGAAIRFWLDGATPTAAVGVPAAAGALLQITGQNNLRRFLAIRQGGTDATLSVIYER